MDYKKNNAPTSIITRDCGELESKTGNLYETVVVASRRANQIGVDLKNELNKKLEEFASYTDNLEEIFENREQIEISKFYERLPKPTLLALQEILENRVNSRIPSEEEVEQERKVQEAKEEAEFTSQIIINTNVEPEKSFDEIIAESTDFAPSGNPETAIKSEEPKSKKETKAKGKKETKAKKSKKDEED